MGGGRCVVEEVGKEEWSGGEMEHSEMVLLKKNQNKRGKSLF